MNRFICIHFTLWCPFSSSSFPDILPVKKMDPFILTIIERLVACVRDEVYRMVKIRDELSEIEKLKEELNEMNKLLVQIDDEECDLMWPPRLSRSPNGSTRANMKRPWLSVLDDLSKGTKERRRTYIGESLSSQQLERKRKEEDLQEPLRNPLRRSFISRIKKVKAKDPESLQRSDLQNIIEKIKELEHEAKAAGIEKMKATDEMKPRLLEIGKEIEKFNEQWQKDSMEVMNFEEIFMIEHRDSKRYALKEEGSLESQEHVKYCLEKLFSKDNKKVEVSNFQKEIENPGNLEPIASRIKQERGKDTEFELLNIQDLVCAAIKQMEDLPAEELQWDKLLKWGAVLNKAKDLGFQVKFAEIELKKNLYAYFNILK
ncbi:hypothetical protein PTKIN_Ptkin06aG0059400 [Pterospermum kingtungense]